MKKTIDHDGKSQTSSSVDQKSYPAPSDGESAEDVPTHEQIARLAEELWIQRGRPSGTADQDWREAEEQLLQHARSTSSVAAIHKASGSVQR